jgi:hypothetical protein
MNQRERILFILTALFVLGGVFWKFVLEDGGGGTPAAADTAVEVQKKRFEDNLRKLEDIYIVERKYRAIGLSPLDTDPARSPVVVFQDYVHNLARQRGFDYPNIRSDSEDIDGVEDYQFLSVVLRTEGPFDNTIQLLRDFERSGLLIRDVDLRGSRDRDLVNSRITVSRIARRQAPIGSTGGLFETQRR